MKALLLFRFHIEKLKAPIKMASNLRPRCLFLLQCKTTSIHHVKQLHAQLIINGFRSTSLFAKLIKRYCNVSSPRGPYQANRVFNHIDHPNVFALNTLIRCVPPRESIHIFADWVSRGILVFDDLTYNFALGACARLSSVSSLWEGKQMHARTIKCGFLSNIWVQTTAVHFYASNSDVKSARKMFDEILVPSSACWNAMIGGYCSQRRSSYSREAFLLFRDMLIDACDVKPNDTTMVCVLSAASHLGLCETGTCVHGYMEKMIREPDNDIYLGTGLLDMYSKCGCLDVAISIFMKMQEKNVLTWTAMATGLAIHGKGKEALEYLDEMMVHGVKPNLVTFTSLLSACCHSGLVEEGLHLFHNMGKKFKVLPHMQHYGCIVHLLGWAGRLKEAYEFILSMPIEPDAIVWRILLSACAIHGDVLFGEKVGNLLLQLQLRQSSSELASSCEDYVALSNVFASVERWEDAEKLRIAMKAKGIYTKPGISLVSSSCNSRS